MVLVTVKVVQITVVLVILTAVVNMLTEESEVVIVSDVENG